MYECHQIVWALLKRSYESNAGISKEAKLGTLYLTKDDFENDNQD